MIFRHRKDAYRVGVYSLSLCVLPHEPSWLDLVPHAHMAMYTHVTYISRALRENSATADPWSFSSFLPYFHITTKEGLVVFMCQCAKPCLMRIKNEVKCNLRSKSKYKFCCWDSFAFLGLPLAAAWCAAPPLQPSSAPPDPRTNCSPRVRSRPRVLRTCMCDTRHHMCTNHHKQNKNKACRARRPQALTTHARTHARMQMHTRTKISTLGVLFHL